MNLAQIRTLVRTLVGDGLKIDPQGQPIVGSMNWTDDEIVEAINWAISEYCGLTGATQVETSTAFATTGISSALPDVIRVIEVAGLDETNVDFESLKASNWRTLTGTPRRWLPWDGTTIRVVPMPTSSTPFPVRYIQKPAELIVGKDDAQSPDSRIPVNHHRALQHLAAHFLLNQVGPRMNPQLADKHHAYFMAAIGLGKPLMPPPEPPAVGGV